MPEKVPEKFNTPYQPQDTETAIYKKWEESGFFNPDNLPGERTEPFTIIMPPPNANGSLHAGHALFVTLQDIMVRFARMQGKKTLWLPGADHAGFETQVVYEKKLEKEGRSRFDMQPQDLYKEILDFTLSNKSFMEGQIRQLGASCDWSRETFTLDEKVIKTVYSTFNKLNDDGLLYRGSRIVNWCPKHQTSLSNLETERETRTDNFYYLKYGPFVIATARPETKFGDKYVVMHPDDARYAQYKQGDQFDLEWINGPITATVIKDEAIDMELGTGVMTITPWHDQADFDIASRHRLPFEQIIDWRGKLLPIAGEFAGMNIKEARTKIVEKLQTKGLVEKVDEKYTHEVPVCYKCNREIEPQVRPQWFVKMKPLAERAIAAVKNKEVHVVTESHERVLLHWLENIQDWNISRQIIWGIPIPAWSKGDEWKIQEETPGEGWERDPDTFDTWFSSGQWPFATLGYPDNSDFKTFYPTSVMETGADIIFFWVARMLMLGLYCTGEVPFKEIYLHGLVRDAKGMKMSKSKGNVISPLEISNEYGTDALRMGLVVGNTPGTDLNLDPHKIGAYKKFANKLWNVTRFVLSQENTGEVKQDLKEEFEAMAADVTKDMEEYRIYMAAEKLYHYVWDRFAAEILEESKGKPEYGATLYYILTNVLKLLHPFMPFITEEIWQSVSEKDSLLMVEAWPTK
ncbi:valine--tRNA ligase [Candidatus Adlerbacteria bacterium RIFOXYC1_FULL_48_26]|uniref:Valine--tRNA ligase n=1 Tax=Candidatus Adlerbacteria bacterium RIFOXYC1_FULL_48_26 TaxID=1797247 RepID=A0A1F4Y302_9BACT|nr:MAG: valine--tRNA ligase [Candidatus Adlerbacteria bacterium RIFOXYC1_FULL_48_26]OGC94572.1 MAG: valine--tRNA ligase [Candidatus Adlerbacteria bacterium RIFOXYB1_FULL_48_10]OGC96311.1 MAG: valine--tRNA ligase [Candidatus Adlerbacteria bacterium RIFOXYD1_FULL_48_8]